ncbi:MAG: hypothetical protein ACRDRM_12275, partial [Pseudonocardiaceae bacterium]
DEVIPLHAPFEIVLRGFNRQQVIDYIESLEGRIAMIATDRDSALRQVADLSKLLDHLRRQAEEAATQVDRLQRSSLGGAGVRIQRMLQLAEDEITAMQVSTEQETRTLRERTRAEAEQLLRETTSRCERLEAESARRRKAAEAESAARCQRAEQDSERRRRMAEQQSERDIAQRETEANDRINDYQTRGISGLHQLLRMAGQQLSKRVADVEREVRRFTELRADVTARLSSAHRVLVEAVGEADQPASGEQDEPDKPASGEQGESSNSRPVWGRHGAKERHESSPDDTKRSHTRTEQRRWGRAVT